MRTASLNAEREARLASMGKEVMNPHESTTPATSVQKRLVATFFGVKPDYCFPKPPVLDVLSSS